MSKVISFFQNTTLPVSTMVQLGFLMALFTGLGLFFVFCGIKAMLRSRKVGTGMTSSFVIFLVGCLAMASGIWVDYICVTSGLEWDQELREYEESMKESMEESGLDGDSSQMFTVGEDGQVIPVDGSDGSSDSGIVIESESQPEEILDETSEESDDTADDAENADAKKDAKDESDGESKADSDSDSKKDSKKAPNEDSKETAKTDEK